MKQMAVNFPCFFKVMIALFTFPFGLILSFGKHYKLHRTTGFD